MPTGSTAERSPERPPRSRLLEAYYLLTPAFLAYDLMVGASIRVSAIPTPELRYAYYAGIFGLGFLVRKRPRTGPFVGIAESSLNLLLLILSVLLPIWGAADAAAAGTPLDGAVITREKLLNVLITGPVLVIAFKQNEAALWRQVTGRKSER